MSRKSSPFLRWIISVLSGFLLTISMQTDSYAGMLEKPVAVFSGLDKITARVSKFEVNVGETVEFGALSITPRVCYMSSPGDEPESLAFILVDAFGPDGGSSRIFGGWMFASSPALHAIEHPIFDIWLVDCKSK